MTLSQIIILAAAGFLAGTVNAIAGGGTFFTFAALVFGGLPTLDANATSAVALTPANFASVAAYRAEVRVYARDIVPFAVIGVIGAAAGVWILITLGDSGFRPTVPWLLLLATALFAGSGLIRRLAPIAGQGVHGVGGYLVMAVVAIYGGFFGAGMGIMMLATLSVIESGNFHKINAIKNVTGALIQTVSAVLLIAGSLVHWPQALTTMAASIAGGYVGVSVARKIPERIMRIVVVAVGSALTVVFFLRG